MTMGPFWWLLLGTKVRTWFPVAENTWFPSRLKGPGGSLVPCPEMVPCPEWFPVPNWFLVPKLVPCPETKSPPGPRRPKGLAEKAKHAS